MVVFAADMNGHIESSNVGYDWTHGGFGYGSRNTDGSKLSHLQHVVYEAGSQVGNIFICSWLNESKDNVESHES